MQTSININCTTSEEKLSGLLSNPREFNFDRWRAAVAICKLPGADQSLIEAVTTT